MGARKARGSASDQADAFAGCFARRKKTLIFNDGDVGSKPLQFADLNGRLESNAQSQRTAPWMSSRIPLFPPLFGVPLWDATGGVDAIRND